jgi:hypothetical protein
MESFSRYQFYHREEVVECTADDDVRQLKMNRIGTVAAKHSNLRVLRSAIGENEYGVGCQLHPSLCRDAASNGQFEVLKWLRQIAECPWDDDTCHWAARYGHLKVLQWARENQCCWSERSCLRVAVLCGHLETAQWVQEYGNGCHMRASCSMWPFGSASVVANQ